MVSGTVDGAVIVFGGSCACFCCGCSAGFCGCAPPFGLPRGGGIWKVEKTGAIANSSGAVFGKLTDVTLIASAPRTTALCAITETVSRLYFPRDSMAWARTTDVSNMCFSFTEFESAPETRETAPCKQRVNERLAWFVRRNA